MKNIKKLVETTRAFTILLFGFLFLVIPMAIDVLGTNTKYNTILVLIIFFSAILIIFSLIKYYKEFRQKRSFITSVLYTILLTIIIIFITGFIFEIMLLPYSH
jgi:hypothetical protein